ncbi:general transcription and DNA repair factor IIH helicase subunit XPD-like [Pyrus communis]|uniref:general transcription and DNA repair factor IIH helicase subunit XPD-like n=1 Tax=Pyrus communis TaxID=23211 RepID=UPI0035C03F93
MIFADKRYSRHDKRPKLPGWILSHLRDAHLNLSTDMALHIAREFLRKMAQPYDKVGGGSGKKTLLSQEDREDGRKHCCVKDSDRKQSECCGLWAIGSSLANYQSYKEEFGQLRRFCYR